MAGSGVTCTGTACMHHKFFYCLIMIFARHMNSPYMNIVRLCVLLCMDTYSVLPVWILRYYSCHYDTWSFKTQTCNEYCWPCEHTNTNLIQSAVWTHKHNNLIQSMQCTLHNRFGVLAINVTSTSILAEGCNSPCLRFDSFTMIIVSRVDSIPNKRMMYRRKWTVWLQTSAYQAGLCKFVD